MGAGWLDATGEMGFCVTAVWLVELAGFGLSLEQPTVMEHTISSAAKRSALTFFPQAKLGVPANLLIALMRVMVSPPAAEQRSNRVQGGGHERKR
jgi:hypothetical protein